MTDPAPPHTLILAAAASLIASGGQAAATTRAVAALAGVQAPTIYRLFGDKDGLLLAVAEHVFAQYVAEKSHSIPHLDPVAALRAGWDRHVAFGMAHPDLFRILSADPRPPTPAIVAGQQVLAGLITAIARAGRLRVSTSRALDLLQAAGIGTVLTLLGQPTAARDPGLSVAVREAVLAAMITPTALPDGHGPKPAAVALRAGLDQTNALSAAETHLLAEWLDRIANAV